MLAIVSEMDRGWAEIVWRQQRHGMSFFSLLFGKMSVLEVVYQMYVSGREIDLAGKQEGV